MNRKPNLRITYVLDGEDKWYDFIGDSRCDIDHAIKRVKDSAIVNGQTFKYQSWYVLDQEVVGLGD